VVGPVALDGLRMPRDVVSCTVKISFTDGPRDMRRSIGGPTLGSGLPVLPFAVRSKNAYTPSVGTESGAKAANTIEQ